MVAKMAATPERPDERRFRRLVNTLDHAVVWEFDDTHDAYTFVSEHSRLVLGYDCQAWMADARFFEQRIPEDDLPAVLALFDQLRRREVADVRCEHRMRRADGKVIWVHSGAHYEEQDGCRLFQGVTIDIDHLKRAEEREREARAQAERLAQARDEVLAVVAHDLRNPLNSLELACATFDDPELHARSVQLIRRAVQRMGALIDDLLDAASIRAARLSVVSADLDPRQLIQEVADDFAARAHENGITLELEPAPNAPPLKLRADAQRLHQLLANLVNNALKFTESGGRVTLRLLVEPRQVRIEVRDSGRGIAPEDRDKVFDRAWQSDETAHLGSGMGLYIAKGIVVAHGGTIGVDSELGIGSTFYFTLPV
jgi:PAS domain S-box-containing protein